MCHCFLRDIECSIHNSPMPGFRSRILRCVDFDNGMSGQPVQMTAMAENPKQSINPGVDCHVYKAVVLSGCAKVH